MTMLMMMANMLNIEFLIVDIEYCGNMLLSDCLQLGGLACDKTTWGNW